MHRSSSRYEHTHAGDLTGVVIRRVVEVFYGKVRQDALLGPVFNELIQDWDAHIETVSAFWRYATRLDRTYNSRDFMPAHVRHAQIQASLLPQWLSLFRQTAMDVCTEQGASVLVDIAERMAVSIEMSLARRSQLSSAAHAGRRRGRRSAPNAKRAIAMVSNSHDLVPPRDEAERAYLESLIREDYERCHPGETLDDMKRRASFSKEDRGLYRDWLTIAVKRAAAGSVSAPSKPLPNEPAADETGARHLLAVGESIPNVQRDGCEMRLIPMQSRRHPHGITETATAHLDELLDEALKETFPASDPIAIDVKLPRSQDSDKATKASVSYRAHQRMRGRGADERA